MLLVMAVVYGMGHGLLWWFMADKMALPDIVDVNQAASSIWQTETKYLFWGMEGVRSPRQKVIVVGASNARMGLGRQYLQPLLPDHDVHNMALSASEIRQVKEVVEMALATLSPEEARQTVFVFGLSLANFHRRSYSYNPGSITDFGVEAVRYHVYRGRGDKVVPVVPGGLAPLWKTVVRPYAGFSAWVDLGKKRRQAEKAAAEAANQPPAPPAQPAAAPPTAADMRHIGIADYRARLGTGDGTFPGERLPVLVEIAELIRSHGAKLMLVQLPHVRSNRLAMTEYQDFLEKLAPYSKRLAGMDGVTVVDFLDQDEDEDFMDANHPYPPTSMRWCQTIAPLLTNLK